MEVRIFGLDDRVHRVAKMLAQREGVSLNSFYCEAVRYFCQMVAKQKGPITAKVWDEAIKDLREVNPLNAARGKGL